MRRLPGHSDTGVLRVGVSLFTMTPRLLTGTASYARGLLREFARPEVAIEPVVIVSRLMRGHLHGWLDAPLKSRELRSIPVRDTPASRLALLAQALVLSSTVTRQLPSDLNLMHYPLTLPFPAAKQATVVTVHDMQHYDQPQFFSRSQHVWRWHAYDRAARSASLVVTVSEHARTRIVDRLEISPEHVEAIAHGIDHDVFRTTGHDDEALLAPLAPPDRFLLYPAGMWPHKNHRALVQALALAEDPDAVLLLTGPTFGGLDELMDHARRCGVQRRVRHLGFVSVEQLAALYRLADLLVFPSLYEGFGAPPLEAMACGCPVASSDAASLPEVCGQAAVLFDARSPEGIAEGIDRGLADEGTRERLRGAGLRRAAGFTWRAAAEGHVAAFRRAARRAKR